MAYWALVQGVGDLVERAQTDVTTHFNQEDVFHRRDVWGLLPLVGELCPH